MARFLNIFMLCMCFAYVQSDECSGMKLGKTACVPKEHVNTIHLKPSTVPLPMYIDMHKLRVIEIDISSSTMTVLIALDLLWKDDRINSKKPNDTIDLYHELFKDDEWKMIYIPFIFPKNYIDIRYHKMNGHDLASGIMLTENNEQFLMFTTVFRLRFHCDLQDSIITFPFDKHSCNLEVNCS